MSEIMVDELITTLTADVTPSQDFNCVAIYPHLYVANNPAGSLILQVRDANDELIDSSDTVTITSIDSEFNSDAYIHSLIRFDIDFSFRATEVYKLVLTSTGYTYTFDNFVGWLRDYDRSGSFERVSTTYSPDTGFKAPYDYLAVEKRTLRKGVL